MYLKLERNPETLGTPDRERVAQIERTKLLDLMKSAARQSGFTLTEYRPDATHREDGTALHD